MTENNFFTCNVYAKIRSEFIFEKYNSLESKESYFKRQIDNMEFGKEVMIQFYRYLVLGNFITVNSKRGKSAILELDSIYLDQLILSNFKIKSGYYNGLGMAIYNLQVNEPLTEDYKILSQIVIALIAAGFQVPQIEI